MAKIGFEAPNGIGDLLHLINRADERWRLSLVTPQGAVRGYLADKNHKPGGDPAGEYTVVNGDVDDEEARVLFRSRDEEAAITFLYGCYLGIFHGRALEDVQDELSRKLAAELY